VKQRFSFLLLLAALHGQVHGAAVTADNEAQRRRAQRETEERQGRQQAPDIRLPGAATAGREPDELPAEHPCFKIDHIRLEGKMLDAFPWARDYLDGYAGLCIGRNGINLIVKRLSNRIIDKGYITTRVGIPKQDLSSGELKLVLVPGIIRAIRIADPNQTDQWKTAFPMRPGDLLNLRDIEQGLEQMKRVPSQDASINIVPGETTGESDIVLTVKRNKPWKVTISADDSGATTTGQLQGSVNFSYDNPLGLNDLFNIGINNDLQGDNHRHGTQGNSLSYSVPWGYWTLAFSGSTAHFHQTIKGLNQSFISGGDTTTAEAKLTRVIHRSQNGKTSLQLRTAKRYSKSYIEDAEIESQRRNTTAGEIGLIHRQNIGPAQIDMTLAHREGVPWFGGQEDIDERSPASPSFRYRMQTLDIAAMLPFKLDNQPMRWLGAFRGQATDSPLYATEFFSIGNRWTVRGFDGDQTLAAERGWYFRNEIEIPLAQSGQAAYAGIDHGEVGGPSAALLVGSRLTGAVLGLRGGGKGFTYDLFVGSPVKKPDRFSASTTSGFQLTYQY
jgi:hemolysin activation/secretion protein